MTEPENARSPRESEEDRVVASLDDYKPRSKQYEVSITFSGEAASSMLELMAQLNADSPNDVAKRAIGLLLAAQGKRILLLDPKTGTAEAVEI